MRLPGDYLTRPRPAIVAVCGAGPHGLEVAGVLAARVGPDRVKLYDDNLADYEPVREARERHVLGAAWPATKRLIAGRVEGWAEPYQEGIVVFPGAHVSPSAHIGCHTHIGYSATVSHGCQVGEFVTVCAGAVLGGEVTVGDDVFVGANATILHGGLKIGKAAVIGAGSVVLHDIPAGETWAGNPARRLGC